MMRRLAGIVGVIAGATLIIGSFWTLPYWKVTSTVCAMICMAFGLYEALRPDPAKPPRT
jgi:hypothetical protein